MELTLNLASGQLLSAGQRLTPEQLLASGQLLSADQLLMSDDVSMESIESVGAMEVLRANDKIHTIQSLQMMTELTNQGTEQRIDPGLNDIQECPHESLTAEGTCSRCGITIQRLYNIESLYATHKTSDKSIAKDLENISVSDDIKHKAEEIYMKLNSLTKRGNRRKQLIFFCIYNSYNELGIPQDPKFVAKLVGIKISEMTKALSTFSQAQTGYKPPTLFITAKNLLPQYCEALNVSTDTLRGVLQFADEILMKDQELLEKFPQKVAAGILLYYLTINGININKKIYAGIIQLSEVTITNMYKHVARIHNSDTTV